MTYDKLENAARYYSLNPLFQKAFDYLRNTDLANTAAGKIELVPDALYAIHSEYETRELPGEKMEAHKKFLDIQLIVSGSERIGIALLKDQQIAQPYSEEKDFHLFQEEPDYFLTISAGEFAIFYPTDLHMPNISTGQKGTVRKVVMKVRVSE
jgi:YhcH/YjgK/YiaL family protein